MLPLLRRLGEAGGAVAVRTLAESVADEFGLTEEERAQRIPSGGENLLVNRLQWARTYMAKAGLVAAPKRGLAEITDRGRALLAEAPTRIDNGTLARFPEYVDWLTASRGGSGRSREERPVTVTASTSPRGGPAAQETPLERIASAVGELEEALRSDILARVRDMTPAEFEGLIVKLLLAMGYGQGSEEMAEALGGTGDGGVDGLIHQDPLGLDRVYIQAKRYREGNNVSSPDIRNFIGALNIHRATKGVFVTASAFTPDARQSAQGSTVQVVLIDGRRLADLMLRYKVGVLVRNFIELKELDEGFFGE
jgi:restriction system protein